MILELTDQCSGNQYSYEEIQNNCKHFRYTSTRIDCLKAQYAKYFLYNWHKNLIICYLIPADHCAFSEMKLPFTIKLSSPPETTIVMKQKQKSRHPMWCLSLMGRTAVERKYIMSIFVVIMLHKHLPIWHQAITWTNANPGHWHIYVTLWGDELNECPFKQKKIPGIKVTAVTLSPLKLTYHKVSNIRRTKCQNLNDSCLVLQLSVPNPLKPSVKSIMKMLLEQRRQAMLQLHLSYRQLYCQLRCVLY